jgi:hypothetical protein
MLNINIFLCGLVVNILLFALVFKILPSVTVIVVSVVFVELWFIKIEIEKE